jgi:protein-disulfide isomerase
VIGAKIDEKLSGKAAPAPAPQLPSEPAAPAQPVDLEDGNYVLGKANAPVTIVEFTDFQCPFCGRAHEQTYPQIKSEYIDSGKVRYTIRNYPLPFHENAEKSAEAAECAGEQGKYWEYVDTLFAHQDALTVTNLKQYAKDLKLTSATFDTCLDSGKFAQLIEDDTQAGSAAGVSGTPSFFVNGKILVGAQPYTSFKAAIDAELQ